MAMIMPDFDEKDFEFTRQDIDKYIQIPDLKYMITYLIRYFGTLHRTSRILKISISHLSLCRKEERGLSYKFGRNIAYVYLMAHFMTPEKLENNVNLS